MAQSLDKQILELLERKPGQVASAMGEQLKVDKKKINSLLYGQLKGHVRQDKKYRWYLVSNDTQPTPEEPEETFANTDLAKLCRYYLACMGQDDVGISTFAQSKYGAPDYSELAVLPKNSQALIDNEGFQEILGRVRSDRSPKAMYLGYPTSLKMIRSKRSNWEGYMVEPILLFPIEIGSNSRSPQLDISYPIINRKALQSYTNAEREALMEELVQLEEELGIGGENNNVELDEIALRLQAVRTEWPWQEDIDPDQLNVSAPNLSEIKSEGIFNRAVVIIAETSPFTQGLEGELRELAKKPQGATDGTALGAWLSGKAQEVDDNIETQDLIEVLPMNLEQHNAVHSALTKPLTIITGPPGTGKSQVVTNLLINAAWQGKRVLFASKNNKAVDVVETRVNNLGTRPILLRVGSSAYQTSLAEYLMAFLSTTASEDEKLQFEEASNIHKKLLAKMKSLDGEIEALIQARNLTDKLEQDVEKFRSELSDELFQSLRTFDLPSITQILAPFKEALKRADKNQQQFFVSLLWPLLERSRFDATGQRVDGIIAAAEKLGLLESPDSFVDSTNLSQWHGFAATLEERLDISRSIEKYFSALKHLQESTSLEEISLERVDAMDKIASNSETLWKFWLKLQPAELSATDRNMLNRYNATLKMVIDTGPGAQLSKSIYREYRSLFSKVSHLLPCWATTSLSAKGKIPFEPGVFDLVVFDEASQCDIASALPLLYRAKAAVIIGDPHQLSHISGLQKGQDQQLLDKYDLVSDYLHWAYSYNSLFDLASGLISHGSLISLLDHHRSHADVIEFSNKEFYEGRLRVATRYDNLKIVSSKEPGVRWVDVKGSVKRPAAGGAINSSEVTAVVNTLEELILQRGYEGSVGVVSPFRAQANAIRVAVEANDKLSRALQTRSFLSDTVHKFQGDERDVMIFSPVVSKGITAGGLGFLRSNGNLFNVAITRARAQLIVVGDLAACGKCDISYLSNFVKYTQQLLKREKQELSQKVGEDLGRKYPEISNPEQVSDWERIFYSALYEAGIKTLPQYRVEKYALDLAIVDGDRRLDIEVDGEKYHRNWTGELCRRDQIRNHRLYELGWDVLRFWVYEIRDDMPSCIEKIKAWKNSNKN